MTAGQRYVFSAYCTAIDSLVDPSRIVLNHAPFSLGTVVGGPEARPKLSDMVPGQWFHYIFDATATGQLKMILGVDGAGDVTLERPMLDKADTLRGYMATDLPEPPAVGSMNWDLVPHNGLYEGSLKLASYNMSRPLNNGSYKGFRMRMRKSGRLTACQFQIASNFIGETSKSEVNGTRGHTYPVSWKLGFRVFNANSNWQITGSALRQVEWTYTNPDGVAGGNPLTNNSRVLFEMPLDDLQVTEQQRLLFLVYSRESAASTNWPSMNMTANIGRPALGLNPPRAVNLFFGDDPLYVEGTSSNLTPHSTGCLYGLGIRYNDGSEDGGVEMDSTPSAFRTDIGGNSHVRQRWSTSYYRRANQLVLGVYRLPNATPEAPLTVRISGPDISAMTLGIPAAQIQIFDFNTSQYPLTNQLFDLPGELILSPKSVYTVEIYSAGTTSGLYKIHGVRHSDFLGVARLANCSIPQPSPFRVIQPHKWSGSGEKSSNGGSSWQIAGWAEGGTDLPIALVINRRMAMTLEDLPA